MEPRGPSDRQRRKWAGRVHPSRSFPRMPTMASVIAAIALVVSGCSFLVQESTILSTVGVPAPLPRPSCGGVKILIEGALPCEQIVSSAIGTLMEQAPAQMARGVTRIDVVLAACPRGQVLPAFDCLGNDFAQFVTVFFGPAPPGGPIEPSLTVILDPVSGTVLGIQNPLIR